MIPSSRPTDNRECEQLIRPCPFVSCPYHLVVDTLTDGALQLNRRVRGKRLHLAANEADPAVIDRFIRLAARAVASADPAWSCALDVAKRGPYTYEQIGAVWRRSEEWARQEEQGGRERARLAVIT